MQEQDPAGTPSPNCQSDFRDKSTSGDTQTPVIRGRAWRRDWPIIISVVFALVWLVHRAQVQSITVDEANTFLRWVDPPAPEHWTPNANNHVPNSLLMRAAVATFGMGHLSVRSGALLGGLIYVLAVAGFCWLIPRRFLSSALLICFLYNPFLMDYLVAARGYSLALGFLAVNIFLLARLVIVRGSDPSPDVPRQVALASAIAGLSFSANFSFAWANAFLLAAFFGWAWRLQRPAGWPPRVKLVLAAAAPGMLITFLLVGSVLANFPKEELFWGTRSLGEMWRELRTPLFPGYNPHLVHPLLARLLGAASGYLLRGAAIAALGYSALLLWNWRRLDDDRKRRLGLAISLCLIVGVTFLAHYLQFKWFGVLLPLERTSIFFLPLATAMLGMLLSVAPSNTGERLCRGFGVTVLLISSVHFLGCLRDGYFLEWKQQADVRAAFPILREQCRRLGVRTAGADGFYTSILNFYRKLEGAQELEEFRDELNDNPPTRPVYVVREGQYGKLIADERLTVVYRGPATDLVIAVREEAGKKP